MLKKCFISAFLFILIITALSISISAEEAVYSDVKFVINGFSDPELIHDDSKTTYSESYQAPSITVTREDKISAVYILFDKIPGEWTLTEKGNDTSVTCGQNGFLHEYVDMSAMFSDTEVTELKLSFGEGTAITEIYVFSEGDIPDWVQIWQAPCEKADLMLIASHADDVHLYFAGILPYYSIVRDLNVQVVYLVNHYDKHDRPHEQLNGLWEVGVRNYPVISDFPDLNVIEDDRTEAKKQALAAYSAAGYTFDSFVEYLTENIRRFKPLVIVSHDTDGEYGHGTHVICADAIAEALNCCLNASKYSESIAEYGTWMPDKVYFHMYSEGSITLEAIDTLYAVLDSKSPFEISQAGFACHKSQLWTEYAEWLNGTQDKPIKKASEISEYSPSYYGLYHTSVGPDANGDDFFENVKTHAERDDATLTDAPVTLTPLETLPSELVVETNTQAESETAPSEKSEDKGEKDNSPIIFAVVIASVAICIIIVILTVASSKTSVRSRRLKKIKNRNK